MKKFTFALMALLTFTFSLKAQQYVSTEPANRNVILEEFTGRACGYCTDGHRIANELMAANPGRLWAINIHAGGYAQTSYPNMITQDGNTIHGGFQISGYPTGVVNRTTAAGQGRNLWQNIANQQLSQASECNIGGMVVLNPETRVATITVEVYYTGNSSVDQNYLTVAMLQDSILGSQSDYGNYNPTQWLNGQYVHMHILRDVVSESAWGDPISPTTQGTLITRTYEYLIPESIGSPNGVEVDLNNIFFLAWVSEQQQGQAARPILTGCKLDMIQGVDEPIYPSIKAISQVGGTTCTHVKGIEVNVQNLGTETLTNMTLEVELEGQTQTINWEGELPQFGMEIIDVTVEVPFGTYPVHITITQANGEPIGKGSTGMVECLEWQDLEIEGEDDQLKLELMQDKFGNQITWEFTSSDGTVLASGGPYTMLMGGTATQIHLEYVTVPVNECVKFTIHDSGENGICCNYGNGYFTISDSQNNVIIGNQSNGDFGKEASFQIKTQSAGTGEVIVGETQVTMASETEAHFVSSLQTNMYPEQVGFMYGKLTSSQMNTVVGVFNEFQKILASVDDLEPNKMYRVKAFAVVNGETYYGQENHFFTSYTGLGELENSLRLYPNPTSGVLNIEGEGIASLEVYNAIGQRILMKEVSGNSVQINTEAMDNGAYFIRIHANDGTVLNRTFSVAR